MQPSALFHKKIKLRITDHIRNEHRQSGSFYTLREGRGHPAALWAEAPSRKVNWNWKIRHRNKNYQGKLPPGVWSYHLFAGWSVWLPPREFSFSRIKTTCLLVASPGRWGLNLNPGDSVIIELQCFGYLLFILKLLKRVSCSTESALRCPG